MNISAFSAFTSSVENSYKRYNIKKEEDTNTLEIVFLST